MNFERLWHWYRFAPNLGNNLELPEAEQLTLEIGVGLTKVEIESLRIGLQKIVSPYVVPIVVDGKVDLEATEIEADKHIDLAASAMAEAWDKFARLGPGNHSINGRPLTCLKDYLKAAMVQPGVFQVIELFDTIIHFNTVTGSRALFSVPPAGGVTSTRQKNSAQGSNQMGGH